jgi:hypothetical protein
LTLKIFKYNENENIYFAINSTPFSESIFFDATVTILDATRTEFLHVAKWPLTEYKKDQVILTAGRFLMPFATLTDFTQRYKYLAENGVLNVQCEVSP